jgi:hypothetical protein
LTQTYYTAKGWRIFIYLFGPVMIAALLSVPFLIPFKSDTTWVSALCIAFGAFMLYALIETAKWHLVISDDEIQSVGWLKTKTLRRDQISGYRTNEQYTFIIPKNRQLPTIKFGYTTAQYSQIQQLLAAAYPDVDVEDALAEEEAILASSEFGPDEASREQQLKTAQQVVKWLNITGGAIGAWLFLHPDPYDYACWAGLAFPLLAVCAQLWAPRLIRLGEKKQSTYPTITIALLLPALGLMLRSVFDIELVAYASFWPIFGQVALAVAIVLTISSRNFLFRRATAPLEWFNLVIITLVYAFGSTYISNFIFDQHPAATYQPVVLGKSVSTGKTTTYHLKVTPWGPRAVAEEVTVTEEYYKQVAAGDHITIKVRPGWLNVPWFVVVE